MSPTDTSMPAGRHIATTRLLDGVVLIGETITISTIIDGHNRRTVYRGTVFDIRQWDDGCDYARMTVLGMREPISIRLEPVDEPV